MKITYQDIQGKAGVLRSLTGLTLKEFDILLESFEIAWTEFIQSTFHNKARMRAYGAGRPEHLETSADKLLFILVYFRIYPTQAVQGFLFGLSQAQAHEWVHRLSDLLNDALDIEQELPERRPWKLDEILRQCPSLEFMIDGTERRINRPKDKDDRKTYYSGKKKAHTVKNNIINERGGKIVYLSDTYEGKKHDKKIADEEEYQFPKGSTLWQDTGFQGYGPQGVKIKQPQKKPKQKEFPPGQKEKNRKISKVRVEVEHHIGGVKRCQIVVQKFRNRKPYYVDDVMETACGLHNFRRTHRQGREKTLAS